MSCLVMFRILSYSCGNVTKMGSRETKSEAKGVRMGGEMDGGRGIGN